MTKKFLIIAVTAMLAVTFTTASYAQSNRNKPCPKLGYCAPGTCAVDGTTRACNPKNCSKKNCRS
jgi:hypothetical protein